MTTHKAWILAMVSMFAIGIGEADAQHPTPIAPPSFATVSAGRTIAPVSYEASACGACAGSGCGICGVPSASGFRLSNHHGGRQASKCGCGSSACGGGGGCGILGMRGGNACNSCGGDCGGRCGIEKLGGGGGLGGGMGGGFGGGQAIQAMQAMHASRGGGFGTQMLGKENGPFGGGGCCAPIWYDFAVEYMYLSRDSDSSQVNTTSRNAAGPIVLGTEQLDLDEAHGVRFTYAYMIGPSTNLEFTYFGAFDWDGSDSVSGDGDLNSVFSVFGTEPVNGTVIGFPQTVDQADFHSLSYESKLQNFELNGRRRWTSAGCLLHGSYLAGVRYLKLEERLEHDTRASVLSGGGSLDYNNDVENDAFGFQIGGDLYVCVSPRFKLGVELKGGVYGNDASSKTVMNTVDRGFETQGFVDEEEDDTDAAFVGELGVNAMFRVTPRLMIRGGYSLLYLDGFATSAGNFNTESPFNGARDTFFNNSEDMVYNGARIGMTYTW